MITINNVYAEIDRPPRLHTGRIKRMTLAHQVKSLKPELLNCKSLDNRTKLRLCKDRLRVEMVTRGFSTGQDDLVDAVLDGWESDRMTEQMEEDLRTQ